jgi:DNA modification methylase
MADSLEPVVIHHGDCRDVLRDLPPASVHAVVTDPPYELGFMGRAWDASGIACSVDLWREVLRVLKPGGYLLSFGAPRTAHRMACAVEDAGFEIRDTVTWHYASGFPKSLNLPGGLGTALKPASEPITVARKPLARTVAQTVLAHGTGALNIDGCRVPTTEDLNGGAYAKDPAGRWDGEGSWRYSPGGAGEYLQPTGRWPSNVVFSHAPECGPDDGDPCVEGCPVAELNIQSGVLRSGGGDRGTTSRDGLMGPDSDRGRRTRYARDADEGGASRFFPTFRYQAKAPASERPKVDGVAHPTVKPLALMRWLVRLVTPQGGTILDPFAGSGTTIEAAMLEDRRVIGIEQDGSYLPLIEARVERVGLRISA